MCISATLWNHWVAKTLTWKFKPITTGKTPIPWYRTVCNYFGWRTTHADINIHTTILAGERRISPSSMASSSLGQKRELEDCFPTGRGQRLPCFLWHLFISLYTSMMCDRAVQASEPRSRVTNSTSRGTNSSKLEKDICWLKRGSHWLVHATTRSVGYMFKCGEIHETKMADVFTYLTTTSSPSSSPSPFPPPSSISSSEWISPWVMCVGRTDSSNVEWNQAYPYIPTFIFFLFLLLLLGHMTVMWPLSGRGQVTLHHQATNPCRSNCTENRSC